MMKTSTLLLTVIFALVAFGLVSARRRKSKSSNEPYTKCGGEIVLESTDATGEVTSPKRPHKYPNNAKCEWKIVAPEGTRVKLEFHGKFQIQRAGRDGVCSKDYVEIWDEDHDHEVAKLCGRTLQYKTYITNSNVMWVQFVSDGRKRRRGFEASLSVMENDGKKQPEFNPFVVMVEVCAVRHEDGSTEVTRHEHTDVLEDIYKQPKHIQTPNYPDPYGKNTDCVWGITVQDERLVKLEFGDDFQLQDSQECHDDVVSVYNKIDFDLDQELAWLCKNEGKDKVYQSKSNQMTVRFHSDGLKEYTGFRAAVSIGDRQVTCGPVVLTPGVDAFIATPNYPKPYPANNNCLWSVSSPEGTRISVKFDKDISIELDEGDHEGEYEDGEWPCNHDHVDIWEGKNTISAKGNLDKRLAHICGEYDEFEYEEDANEWLGPYISKSNHMTIKFESDGQFEEKGFKATLSIVEG